MIEHRNVFLSLFKKYIQNVLRVNFLKRNVTPISCALYVTRKCNFKCSYCIVRDNREYNLSLNETKRLLGLIREEIPSITITGGEPLLRRDIVEILREAEKLRFYPISLFTNLSLIDRKLDVLNYINMLSTSLDSLNSKNDTIIGVKGATELIIRNIKKYSKLQKQKKFIMNINCVISKDNFDDVLDVARFAFANDCLLSIGIVVNNGIPQKELINNEKYIKVMDELIKLKKKRYPISNSLKYLKTIRDFKSFRCHPFLIPRILSNGLIGYPCNLQIQKTTNILDHESFKDVLAELENNHYFECSKSCYLGCYVMPSILIESPMVMIKEFMAFTAKIRSKT